MTEFTIKDIKCRVSTFQVEIELPGGEKRFYGFPLNEGLECDNNGIPNFILEIKERLENEDKVGDSHYNSIENLKKMLKNKTYKFD